MHRWTAFLNQLGAMTPLTPLGPPWHHRVQVILLLYVMVAVPLRIGFGIEVEFGTVSFWVDAVVDVYFICDVAMNFRTAYYNSHGVTAYPRYHTCRLAIPIAAC